MSVNNNGFNVVISGINTLSNFTASNVKIQDNYIYTITNNAKGNDANGAMLLSRSGANNIILDGRNTYICTVAQINGGTTNDPVYDNTYISIKDSVLIMKTSVVSEIIAPMKGNDNTQIHFKTTGCTWNSKHSGTELKGSTIFFEGGGDGHLGKHKLAKVENVKMIWKATSRNEFVLGMHPNWDDTDKPSPMKALRFISVLGNDYISFFTWNNNTTPADINNAFLVNPDWCYDVALPNTKPDSIRRSYRRGDVVLLGSSYWSNINMNITYLWVDPYTTLSSSGVIDSGKIYLNKVNYNGSGTNASDNASDLIAMRFSPLIQNTLGDNLDNVNITVINNNSLTLENNTGLFRDKIACLGYTNLSGKFNIQEPTVKNYVDTTSYLTDSLVIKNRTANKFHKWWETDSKLILVHDSRNTSGATMGETYEDFTIYYRRKGYVFDQENNTFKQPYNPVKTLTEDINYNTTLTSSLPVSYNNGITTITLPDTQVSLDLIYKSIIDFHSSLDSVKNRTILPITQNTKGIFTFTNKLAFIYAKDSKIISNEDDLISTMKANFLLDSLDNIIGVKYEDITGMNFLITCNTKFAIYGERTYNGVTTIIPFESELDFKSIKLKTNEVIQCVVSGFGYKTKYFRLTKDSNFDLYLDKEALVNNIYNIEYLESIKSYFRTVVDSPTVYAVEIMNDMSGYNAKQFLAGFAWWIYKYGDLVAILELNIKKVNPLQTIFDYGTGFISNNTNGFIVRLTNNITVNRDDGYYIPVMILNNGSFKTVKMNTSNINLSLPKYTELETNISTDSISTVMNAINSSLNSNFEFVHDKLSLVDNKLVSLGTINEKITEIKTSTRKKEGTKLS